MVKIKQVKKEKHLKRQRMAKTLAGIGKIISGIMLTALMSYSLIACQNNEVIPMEKDISAEIIQLILNSSEVEQYLHPDAENRLPVRVVTNNLIPNHSNVIKFDMPVLFSSDTPSEPYLEIITFRQSENYAEFFIRYDVEGISISGKAIMEEKKVSLSVIDVIES